MITLNANGLLTTICIGNRKVSRLSNIATYARANNLDFMGIHEPHIVSDAHNISIIGKFQKYRYTLQSQAHPSEYGGVGIA